MGSYRKKESFIVSYQKSSFLEVSQGWTTMRFDAQIQVQQYNF